MENIEKTKITIQSSKASEIEYRVASFRQVHAKVLESYIQTSRWGSWGCK